jgi:1-phosphatidylinositol-4-phosphate 5-kinase
MANIFPSGLQMHTKFDIKGSTEGRTAGVKLDLANPDPSVIFKDLDVDLLLQVGG